MISNNDYRMTRLSCIQYIKNTENINEVWNDVKGIYYQRPVNRTSSVYFDIDGTLAYFYRDGKGLTYEEMYAVPDSGNNDFPAQTFLRR